MAELPASLDTYVQAGDEVVALMGIARLAQLRSHGELLWAALDQPPPARDAGPLDPAAANALLVAMLRDDL